MFNSVWGDVYEIEPWYLEVQGQGQVIGYVSELYAAAQPAQLLKGEYWLTGDPYDWNETPFRIGTGVGDWPGKMRIPMFHGVFDLVADYAGQGVVLYWLEPNLTAVEIAIAMAAWDKLIAPNERLVTQPNWIPGQPVRRPAYILSQEQACMATSGVILVAGGIMIAVSITDDLVPGGQFDDFLITPVGMYLINWGLKLAQPIPTGP